jgi:hypothetical protein
MAADSRVVVRFSDICHVSCGTLRSLRGSNGAEVNIVQGRSSLIRSRQGARGMIERGLGVWWQHRSKAVDMVKGGFVACAAGSFKGRLKT